MLVRNDLPYSVKDMYFFKIRPMWAVFWKEHPSFWCICGYLFIEYFRPQSIYPQIDILPWAQLFLILSLGLSFFDKKSKLRWSWTHTWVVLFALQIEFSFLFAYDVLWSKEYHINFYQWIIIYFVITSIVTTKERFYIFLMIFFLCSLKIAIGTARVFAFRGFSFTSWGLQGPPGYFQNSGELAILMLTLFCLSVYMIKVMWGNVNRLEKFILVLATVTPALTIVGASSRGGQLALVAAIILILKFKILNIKVFVLAILATLSFLYILPDEQKSRFESLGSDGTSTQRLLYWTNGIEMIKEHPFTGVGYYNFIPYYTDNYPGDINFINRRGEPVAELPHNILIQIGTDAGIPAIVFYISIIVSLGFYRSKNEVLSSIHRGLFYGVIAFFIAGQFVSVAYYPFLWIAAALLVSMKHFEDEKILRKHGGTYEAT